MTKAQSTFPFPEPFPLPPSILSVSDATLRESAADAWRSASLLLGILHAWETWFYQLETKNDADPGVAIRLREKTAICVRVLCSQNVPVFPFRSESPKEIMCRFPVPPSGVRGWQNDMTYRHKMRHLLGAGSATYLQAIVNNLPDEIQSDPARRSEAIAEEIAELNSSEILWTDWFSRLRSFLEAMKIAPSTAMKGPSDNRKSAEQDVRPTHLDFS